MGLSCRYGLVNILAEEHGNCSGAGNKGGQQRGSGSHLLEEKHRLAPPPSEAALPSFLLLPLQCHCGPSANTDLFWRKGLILSFLPFVKTGNQALKKVIQVRLSS